MIDLHFHLLPGIDDGPETIETSLSLARAAARAGAETIVATPHVSRSYPNDPDAIRRSTERVNERLHAEGVSLEVLPGAEIAMTSVRRLDPRTLAGLTLGSSSCLLIEPPFSTVITGFDTVALDLMRSGHRVLVAHPERCPAFHRDSSLLAALVGQGALTSITAGSLAGRFGPHVRRVALRLIDEELVHNVASDAHDLAGRKPGMRQEIEGAGLDSLAVWLTQSTPAAILSDDPLPPRPSTGSAVGARRHGLLKRLHNR